MRALKFALGVVIALGAKAAVFAGTSITFTPISVQSGSIGSTTHYWGLFVKRANPWQEIYLGPSNDAKAKASYATALAALSLGKSLTMECWENCTGLDSAIVDKYMGRIDIVRMNN